MSHFTMGRKIMTKNSKYSMFVSNFKGGRNLNLPFFHFIRGELKVRLSDVRHLFILELSSLNKNIGIFRGGK